MKGILSTRAALSIAQSVADDLGIQLEDDTLLLRKMNCKRYLPLVIEQHGYQLWIDRLYIAYSHKDDTDIHYVYLSAYHIREELRSYADARRLRQKDIRIPKQIMLVYRIAVARMQETEKNYVLFKRG